MKQLKSFFVWLAHYNTPTPFVVLFAFGSMVTAVGTLITLLVLAPPLAILFVAAVFFGIPYLGYRAHLDKERDE